MPTPNMNLTLPIVSGTAGPQYAANINDALTLIDTHNHTAGRGSRIPSAALNIDADVDMASNRLAAARSVRFVALPNAAAEGNGSRALFAVGGDLYWQNGSAYPVKITAGNSLNTLAVAGFAGDYLAAGAQAVYNSAANSYSFQDGAAAVSNLYGRTLNLTMGLLAGANSAITGNLAVTGQVGGGTLNVTGASTLGSTLGVTGATTLSSTLNVTGATTLGAATVAGVLTLQSTVTGNVAASGNVSAGGDVSTSTGTVSGAQVTTSDSIGKVNTGSAIAGIYPQNVWKAYGSSQNSNDVGPQYSTIGTSAQLKLPLSLPRACTITKVRINWNCRGGGSSSTLMSLFRVSHSDGSTLNCGNVTSGTITSPATSSYLELANPTSATMAAGDDYSYYVQVSVQSGTGGAQALLSCTIEATTPNILTGARG